MQTPDTKPKKRVNSKSKGSGFEHTVSKLLASRFAPMQFRRSQSSGAILGGQNEKLLDQFSIEAKTLFVGDVVPSNEEDVSRSDGWRFRFTLECKFYKDVETLEQLLSRTRIQDWYAKAVVDAAKVNKDPLLIFKFNHTSIFAATAIDDLPRSVQNVVMLLRERGDRPLKVFKLDAALEELEWFKVKRDVGGDARAVADYLSRDFENQDPSRY